MNNKPKPTCLMIVGPTGSGKSRLPKEILGDDAQYKSFIIDDSVEPLEEYKNCIKKVIAKNPLTGGGSDSSYNKNSSNINREYVNTDIIEEEENTKKSKITILTKEAYNKIFPKDIISKSTACYFDKRNAHISEDFDTALFDEIKNSSDNNIVIEFTGNRFNPTKESLFWMFKTDENGITNYTNMNKYNIIIAYLFTDYNQVIENVYNRTINATKKFLENYETNPAPRIIDINNISDNITVIKNKLYDIVNNPNLYEMFELRLYESVKGTDGMYTYNNLYSSYSDGNKKITSSGLDAFYERFAETFKRYTNNDLQNGGVNKRTRRRKISKSKPKQTKRRKNSKSKPKQTKRRKISKSKPKQTRCRKIQ